MATGIPLKSLPTGVLWQENASGFATLPTGRLVWVYARGTTTPVSVFSDQALTSPMTQPLATGTDGGAPGYVAAGQSIDFLDIASGSREQAEVPIGMTIFKSGAGKTTAADADWPAAPSDGVLEVTYDTTAGKAYLHARANGTWHVMAGPV